MIDIDNYYKSERDICKISQRELSDLSGVTYASIRRFEETGEIAFLSLVKLAKALELESELECLFTHRYYKSM